MTILRKAPSLILERERLPQGEVLANILVHCAVVLVRRFPPDYNVATQHDDRITPYQWTINEYSGMRQGNP